MQGFIQLGHGGGGAEQREIIDWMQSKYANQTLLANEDSAILRYAGDSGELVFTTDSYVVQPVRFPGGDVGSLAVCGTVNDLAVMGAKPRWLSLGLILEEGLPLVELEQVLDSISRCAHEAGIEIVTGDTKVVNRGKGDGIYINTSGIGTRLPERRLGTQRIAPGQVIIVNGSLGDHAVAVMLARDGLGFAADVVSDCAPLNGLIDAMFLAAGSEDIFAMRDLTRGGLAAALNEFAQAAQVDLLINQALLPVKPAVLATARVLGFDPTVLANEGKLVAFISREKAEAVLHTMHDHPYGREACVIGEVTASFDPATRNPARPNRPLVLCNTPSGGQRILELPLGELLPRIC